ncbi:MAG: hemerythrin domain-containing protein [Campylobacterota bacterium]|nr:hemerythrin domain-containing protein [Campylobacterota bacterium]
MTINEFMTQDHRACDEQFAEAENAVDAGNFAAGKIIFGEFVAHMLNHFDKEESVMFYDYNNGAASGCNPTSVMVMEHNQMRDIFTKMAEALEGENRDAFLGLSENLLFVMQQHNMKEEQMMYNLADNALDSADIIERMKNV